MSGSHRAAQGRSADDLLRQALEALSHAVAKRIARHPQGHLATGLKARLELSLEVPVAAAGGVPTEMVDRAGDYLEGEIEALLAHRAAFRPGRVLCLRCASNNCEHGEPQSSRQVFVGYGPTGLPQFQDYGQRLLERQHPEIDRIYRRPPQLVTDFVSGAELESQLLPAFRERQIDYKIHGQVTAGWFPVPGRLGTPELLALTFQVLSSKVKSQRRRQRRAPKRARRRLGLNILGAGPDGEPLAELYERLGSIRWASAVRWSQKALGSIERSQGAKTAKPDQLAERVDGVLNGIARRLQHHRRSEERRTDHAEKRHQAGDRPTRLALKDLALANNDNILVDTRRETLVVLGEKGRAHVFNAAGKLVTSIRYSQESIENKRKKIWQPASSEAIERLRAKAL